jgi:hypothetical protein
MKSPFAKVLVALLVVAAVLAWAMRPKHMPKPDEANRVWHPEDGYSIISPPGWKRSFETAEGTLNRANKGWLRVDPVEQQYHPPSLVVTRLPKAPDPAMLSKDQFHDGEFHSLPAHVFEGPMKKEYAHRIIFEDRGEWFEINLTIGGPEDIEHSDWWPYIDSFRYDPSRATKATTKPASAPVIQFSS